jgi:hypothetical protein
MTDTTVDAGATTTAATSDTTATQAATDTTAQTAAATDTTATTEARPKLVDETTAATTDTSDFKVPDAYKDKPWAQKIKTQEDLYKQIDNLDGLVGKKAVVPDFEKATPEEMEEYFARTRPADKTAYDFGENVSADFAEPVTDLMHKYGVPPKIATQMAADYAAIEQAKLAEAMSSDGFKAVMQKSFGDKFDGAVSQVVALHKTHLSGDDQKMMDTLPNEYLGLVYRLSANMAKAYGAAETGQAADPKGSAPPSNDIASVQKNLRQQIRDLDNRPHTEAERVKLVEDLANTYKGR